MTKGNHIMMFFGTISGFIILLLPFAEIATYIMVAQRIGLGGAIGLTLLSMIVGSILLRLEGMNSVRELETALRRREAPVGAVIRGSCGVIGALLMILPGLLTSALGIILVLPGFRDMIAAAVETWLFNRRPSTSQTGTIIETTYTVIDETPAIASNPNKNPTDDEKKDAGDQSGMV